MKLEQMAVASALVLGGGVAHAAIINVTPNPMVDGSVFNQNVVRDRGVFEDLFKFTIDTQGAGALTLDAAWAALTLDVPDLSGTQFISRIEDFAVSLWRDLAVDQLLSQERIFAMPLTDGDYYFKVTGNATGVMNGNYAFTLATTASPERIAEPQTLALLGLGLLGLVASRRKA